MQVTLFEQFVAGGRHGVAVKYNFPENPQVRSLEFCRWMFSGGPLLEGVAAVLLDYRDLGNMSC